MRKTAAIAALLLLGACTKFGPDCVKIGDTYEKVRDNCGKPARHTYRNGSIFTAEYGSQSFFSGRHSYLTVMFDRDLVNYFEYEGEEGKKEKYAE